MNETAKIESNAAVQVTATSPVCEHTEYISPANTDAPVPSKVSLEYGHADELDILCNFYTNMTIEGLRKLGYQIKVNHYRYPADMIVCIQDMGVTHYEKYLKPIHELRAAYDLSQEQGCESNYNYISSQGGKITVEVLEPGLVDLSMAFDAEALCSIKDSYNKKKGVLICLGRIFHMLCEDYGFTKAQVVEAVESFHYLAARI